MDPMVVENSFSVKSEDSVDCECAWDQWWRHKAKSCSPQHLFQILCDQTNDDIFLPTDSYNQVFDGIYIGDQSIAQNIRQLQELKVSHVMNTAFGAESSLNLVEVCPQLYSQHKIHFLGIEALDCSSFGLWPHFDRSAQFIDQCLQSGGKVLVHCKQGISRSATFVISYLMIKKQLSVTEAVRTVRRHREICPNEGFLTQLCLLNDKLMSNRNRRVE